MKRKIRTLWSVALVLLALSLASCGETKKKPVTITVIHAWGGTGEDHVAMRDIYEGFQKENPDIEVQLVSMPAREEMLRKVEDMIMVGDTPDVITFSGMGQNATYDFIVENNMALDIMPYLKEDEEFAADISQTNLNYWTTEEGQLFTVSDVLSLSGGYWYNEDILEAAGVKEIPENWDAFRAMCYKVKVWADREKNGTKPLQTSPEGYLYFMDHMLLEDENDNQEEWNMKVQTALKRLQEIYIYSTSENAEYSYLDETRLFNEGKLAVYVNGVWGASLIAGNINTKYALLPTFSEKKMSCESACLGYVLGKSGNEQKEEASVRFLKYMLSKKVQTRILEETEQIPANGQVVLDAYEEEKPRLFQAASLVLGAQDKIEVPDNLWSADQKNYFTENIFRELTNKVSPETFAEHLGVMQTGN
ncbi:ABC transporter substrate-binding protein [Blautia sp.]